MLLPIGGGASISVCKRISDAASLSKPSIVCTSTVSVCMIAGHSVVTGWRRRRSRPLRWTQTSRGSSA